MLCYRDMTFCNYLDCANKQCSRRLTDDVIKSASKWWGKDNPPICVFAEKPNCFESGDNE